MQALTQEPLIALCLGFQECVDSLHSPQLNLHVRQIPHHPVEVVGDLWGPARHNCLAVTIFPLASRMAPLTLRRTRSHKLPLHSDNPEVPHPSPACYPFSKARVGLQHLPPT